LVIEAVPFTIKRMARGKLWITVLGFGLIAGGALTLGRSPVDHGARGPASFHEQPALRIIDFPEADTAMVRDWILKADEVIVYVGGGHTQGYKFRELTISPFSANLLLGTRFHFLPKDPRVAVDAVLVGVQIRSGDVVRRWAWPEDHPSQIVGRLWGIAHSVVEASL
jgi:hypothetical protein